jgi:hypothetical protein
VALDGTVIAIDRGANETAYGMTGVLASQILRGEVSNPPPAALQFTAALTQATSRRSRPPSGETPAATSSAPATAPEPAPSNEPVRTYPMEDPNPGAPPPAD